MKFSSRVRLSTRLAGSFGLVLLMLIACTLLSLLQMRQLEHHLQNVVEIGIQRVTLAQTMSNTIYDANSALYGAALSEDAEDVKFQNEKLTKQLAAYDKS